MNRTLTHREEEFRAPQLREEHQKMHLGIEMQLYQGLGWGLVGHWTRRLGR